MSKPSAKDLPVRYTGSNSYASYYKVNGAFNVLHTGHKDHPLTCLDCRLSECDHTEAVRCHLEAHGMAAA